MNTAQTLLIPFEENLETVTFTTNFSQMFPLKIQSSIKGKIFETNIVSLQGYHTKNMNQSKQDINFINCDYKDLVLKMQADGVLVDLILTDPPYGVSRVHQLGFSNMGRTGMNYGDWDYNFDQKEWIKLTSPLVKDGGSVIIFNDWKNLSYLVEALTENGYIIKDLIRWEKSNPMPRNVNSRYVMDFEVAIWAVKGKKKWTFNKPTEVSYLRPMFRTGILLGGNKRIHPTQKSLEVFSELIKIHSNENDLIFDPFSGSGTTAVACKVLNRRFVGCEIDKNYYDKAIKRL